jgi:hypothetical protein
VASWNGKVRQTNRPEDVMKYVINYKVSLAPARGTSYREAVAAIRNPRFACQGRSNGYYWFADKVGLVPNIRLKDNLVQGAAVTVFCMLGMAAGNLYGEWPMGIMGGAIAGLISGTVLSGLVLAIVGLCRR